MSANGCVGFLKFCLDVELFAKIKKDLVSTHSFFTLLLITRGLNKIKTFSHTLLLTLLGRKRAKFQQKILNSMVVGAR